MRLTPRGEARRNQLLQRVAGGPGSRVDAALNAPDIREKLVQLGAVPAPMSSAEFGKLLSDEHARWGRVVREKHIKED